MMKVFEEVPSWSDYAESDQTTDVEAFFDIENGGSQFFLNFTTNQYEQIDMPTLRWMSNYPNRGFYEIKMIRDDISENTYYDIWMLAADIDQTEIDYLTADQESSDEKCCWHFNAENNQNLVYDTFLKSNKIIAMRYIKWHSTDGIIEL